MLVLQYTENPGKAYINMRINCLLLYLAIRTSITSKILPNKQACENMYTSLKISCEFLIRALKVDKTGLFQE